MSNPIRIILFDIGGVLVEFTGISSLQAWTGNRLTQDELWRKWLYSSFVRSFESGEIGPNTFADQLITEMELPVSRKEFIEAFSVWPKAVFPGAVEIISRISSKYVRATLSNSNVIHWPRLMDEMGLRNLFAYHFASHLMGKLKPDREVFEHVVSVLKCEPSAILYLDDQSLNVEAAQLIGFQAVWVKEVQEIERVLRDANVL
jgi:putative hydrolase of the HAD superfamily